MKLAFLKTCLLCFLQDISNFPHFLKNLCTPILPRLSWSPAHLIAAVLTWVPCQYRTSLMLICYLDLAKYVYMCIWLISHCFFTPWGHDTASYSTADFYEKHKNQYLNELTFYYICLTMTKELKSYWGEKEREAKRQTHRKKYFLLFYLFSKR